jgi:hypothetical protein
MAPKYALLSVALPRALSACAGRDRRLGHRGSEELAAFHTVSIAKARRQLAVGLTEMVSTARGERQVKISKEVSSQMTYCKPTW